MEDQNKPVIDVIIPAYRPDDSFQKLIGLLQEQTVKPHHIYVLHQLIALSHRLQHINMMRLHRLLLQKPDQLLKGVIRPVCRYDHINDRFILIFHRLHSSRSDPLFGSAKQSANNTHGILCILCVSVRTDLIRKALCDHSATDQYLTGKILLMHHIDYFFHFHHCGRHKCQIIR